MFTRISKQSEDELIVKLNQLLDEYNHSEKKSITDLQKIDALAEQITLHYRNNPGSGSNEYMRWFLQDQVAKELAQISPPGFWAFNKQRIFMASAPASSPIPTPAEWTKETTSAKSSLLKRGERSRQYQEIDMLIYKFHQAPLKNALSPAINLQKKILHLLNNEVPPDKPQMRERITTLLGQVNHALNVLIESKPNAKEGYKVIPQLNLINPSSPRSENEMSELIIHLARQQNDHSLGDFNLHYLGGNNNRNWLASDEETGEQYVIRLEKADDPETDYLLVDEIKKQAELNHYIAKDYIYYPTGRIKLEENYVRPFNFAVSEFCRRGNLLNYRSKKENPKEILATVADMTQQVASMADALQKRNKVYLDIKPENFLIREDGSVITADIKSVQRTKENQIRMNEISTTACYAPPEYRGDDPNLNAEKFMVYQIGVMMYSLLTNLKDEAKEDLLNRLEQGQELDFNYPIFQEEQGQQAKALIISTREPQPDRRPKLDEIVRDCHTLKENLGVYAEHGADHTLSLKHSI